MELTNEEAAKIIGCMGWGYPEKQIEKASQMAAKALREKSEAEEYRTPKEVIIGCTGPYLFYACPTCGCDVFVSSGSSDKGQSYCENCGQALDWANTYFAEANDGQ